MTDQIRSPEIKQSVPSNSTEMFSLLVDAVKDYAIFALDPNGFILTWNSGARRLKGYEPHEIIGKHFSQFYTEADINRNHPQFELKLAIENGSYEEEGWRVRKDGTLFWANVVITTLRDSHGVHRGFAKVTRDLTERKKAENQLQKSHELLEKRVNERTMELAEAKESAERAVKARDIFLSIASHELRTPLTSLKLQIQMRKRQILNGLTPSLEKIQEMTLNDEKQVNRISRLVDDMFDITHIKAGKLILSPTRTNLGKFITDVIKRYQSHLEENSIKYTLDVVPGVLGDWDQHRIEQVFVNLLTNAIKYGNKTPIDISVRTDKTFAILSVTDHGIGIKKEDQERIFEQFERAVSANAFSGLGLGLYICKQIIDAHKGTIELTSELGKGSTFTVTLPLS